MPDTRHQTWLAVTMTRQALLTIVGAGLQKFHGEKEVFKSDHADWLPISTIEGKCHVHSLKNYQVDISLVPCQACKHSSETLYSFMKSAAGAIRSMLSVVKCDGWLHTEALLVPLAYSIAASISLHPVCLSAWPFQCYSTTEHALKADVSGQALKHVHENDFFFRFIYKVGNRGYLAPSAAACKCLEMSIAHTFPA